MNLPSSRNDFWQDLGTLEGYLAVHRRLLRGASPRLARFFPGLADPWLGTSVVIGPGAEFRGGVCLGEGAVVGAGASLKNCVLWDGASLAPGVKLEDCIVASRVHVAEAARGRVLV